MADFEAGDNVVLDKRGAEQYEGEVVSVSEDEDGSLDVEVAWETGDVSWYHGYELGLRDED